MTDAAGRDPSATGDADADALWRPDTEVTVAPASAVRSWRGRGDALEETDGASPWSEESDAVFASPLGSDHARFGDSTSAGAERVAHAAVAGGATNDDGPVSRRPRRGRVVAWAVVVVSVVAAGLVVRSTFAEDLDARTTNDHAVGVGNGDGADGARGPASLVTEPFVGADWRRLPSSLDERWRTEVAGVAATGRTELTALESGAVVGVFDDETVGGANGSAVVALFDGADGTERWRASFDSRPRAFDVLGEFDDIVVLERLDTDHRAVVGLSAATGEVAWVSDSNDPGVHVALDGAPLVARVSFTVNARLTFIEPATGDVVGRVPGRLVATDYRGTWYVRNADVVSQLDLADGWNPPTVFDTLWVADPEAATVVGDRVVAIDDGVLQVRGDDGEPIDAAMAGPARGDAPVEDGPSFERLAPMVADSFVVAGSRSVFGASLDDGGEVDLRWRATGTPIASRPTDRGLALLVATEGGAAQRVLDASTGREIAVIEMVPGSRDALELVGNGVVVKRSAQVGFERVGLDLDGNRLWSLVGDGTLTIGPGMVVTFGQSDAGIAVTAYGDPGP